MPLFIMTGLDKEGALELRKATRPAHLEWIGGYGDRVKLGGPLLSEDGDPIGSLIMIETDDLAQAQQIFAEDPYTTAELWSEQTVRQFHQVKP